MPRLGVVREILWNETTECEWGMIQTDGCRRAVWGWVGTMRSHARHVWCFTASLAAFLFF
eukprot:1886351-Prorocentrum_lima.AAC.1